MKDLIKKFKNINFRDDSDFIFEEDDMDTDSKEKYVLGVDVGVNNLGLSLAKIDDEYNFMDINQIELINITQYTHNNVSCDDCLLNHTKTFSDWMNHVFQEYDYFFENATYIVIERQPIFGFVVVEQLIYNKWRNKSFLVSPNSMHKYFNIGHYSYEERKDKVESIVLRYITNPIILSNFNRYKRKHDVADSICILIFWLFQKQKEYIAEQNRIRLLERQFHYDRPSGMTVNEWFEQFRYIPCERYDFSDL